MANLPPAEICESLQRLGVQKLLISIQDPSFPMASEEDTGRGTPYSESGQAFLAFLRSLGFDAVQLGPQGQTSRGNPSPYDGSVFSRSTLSIGLRALSQDPRYGSLLQASTVDRLVAETPEEGAGARYRHAHDAATSAMAESYARLQEGLDRGEAGAHAIADAVRAFRADHRDWLERYALYAFLEGRHGADARSWPEPDASLFAKPASAGSSDRLAQLLREAEAEIDAYALAQFLAHEQHHALRDRLEPLGLELFGDLQVGLSGADVWSRRDLFLDDYLMGAPPSRTNPAGQPWGYAVLDPARIEAPDESTAPALEFLVSRVQKSLAEYDGLRIDHPHGFVCPWVYRSDAPDPFDAVQNGARLRCSPDLPDHPALAAFSIARPDQIDRRSPRHGDGWVRELDDDQVARYSLVFDAIAETLGENGDVEGHLVCEVLSTQPYPLSRAMQRHGLGRFRVTQKADLDDPSDVYRAENARPEDWIMVGNHDTAPIWRLAEAWCGTAAGDAQAAHLARVLRPTGDRESLYRALRSDPKALVHAKMAELFVSPATHVLVFFADLFGMKELYNKPGIVDEENWSLQVPRDYEARYWDQTKRGEALDLACVLALALRARAPAEVKSDAELLERLDALARYRIPA